MGSVHFYFIVIKKMVDMRKQILTSLSENDEKEFIISIQNYFIKTVAGENPGPEIINELKILADFVWQMVMEPNYTLTEFKSELTEFLGDYLDDFLMWLEKDVLYPMSELRTNAGRTNDQIPVRKDNDPIDKSYSQQNSAGELIQN